MDVSSARKLAGRTLTWAQTKKPEAGTCNGERLAAGLGAAALAASSVIGVTQGIQDGREAAAASSSSSVADQFVDEKKPDAAPSAAAAPKPPPAPAAKPKNPCDAMPKIEWIPSPNFNSRGGVDIDVLVLHHTASNNTDQDLRTLTDPTSGVSAHLLIPPEPTPAGNDLIQNVPFEERAWHAGEGAINGDMSDMNSRSIGIEIVNDGIGTPYTEHQKEVLDVVVPCLAFTEDIPRDHIVGHKDIAIPAGRKIDPANFDWERLFTSYDSYAKAMGKG